ncbi:CHC2 zinc finger domain-containing protein [Intrasporangium sp.]|uniref:CHC2 zinc finger domain-containing protein n=1 Tax=Intrasporangium sp. TaxID=1925024 RepID=UPI003221D57B
MTVIPGRVDVARIRAQYPIAEVIAAAGVELRPRGRGWVGPCPFHEDHTPSLSVDAIPDRYHCFGCGASGDVIDFVARLHGLDFRGAVAALGANAPTAAAPSAQIASRTLGRPRLRLVRDTDPSADPAVGSERAFEVNALAWGHLGGSAASRYAATWLTRERGIDLTALQAKTPGAGLVGYATPGWTSLTDRLRADGVSDDELLALDLSRPGRSGGLVDTLHGRIVVPVTEPDGRIRGFIGRDITGHPAAPKYRNPTRTAVYDKSRTLYRPSHHELAGDGSVVVVEGVLDALAVAAAAATAGLTHRIAPVTTSGVTVSATQAAQVLALSSNPPRIVLDGDQAGREGTDRWLTQLCLTGHRPALVTRLPAGTDPAEWLTGPDTTARLRQLLDPPTPHHPGAWLSSGSPAVLAPVTFLPGRDLARLSLQQGAREPVRDTIAVLTPLTRWLGPGLRHVLLEQATAEMTRHGWNPHGTLTAALGHALETEPTGMPPPAHALAHPPGPELL